MVTLWKDHGDIEKMMYNRLVGEYGYPENTIRHQVSLSHGKARFIADIVVFVNGVAHTLIECKLNDDLNSFKPQITRYAEILNPKYVVLTNGPQTIYYKVIYKDYQIELKEIPDLPPFGEEIESIGQHKQGELYVLSPERYLALLCNHADLLRSDYYGAVNSLKYLFTIYAAKYHDEVSGEYSFRARYNENTDNIRTRILTIIDYFYENNTQIERELIPLDSKIMATITYDIQKVALSKSHLSFRKIIPQIISQFSSVRDGIGEISTPSKVTSFLMDILQPRSHEKFLDPACGIGGFLQYAAEKGSDVVGLEIMRDVSQITNLSLILSGYPGKCFNVNSLISRKEWPDIVQKQVELARFDLIAVSPPFGLRVFDFDSDEYKLSQDKKWSRAEPLFIEFTLNYLKEGGRAGIILTPNVLFDLTSIDVRKYLLRESVLKGIIYLSNQAFSPLTGIDAYILYLQKSHRGTKRSDKIFLGRVSNDEDYETVKVQFQKFLNGEDIVVTDQIFITNIKSADNLDFNYLKGLLLTDKIEESNYYELRQIAEISTGAPVKRIGRNDSEGEFIYINVKNIDDGLIILDEYERISLIGNYDKYMAKKGDIIFSRSGTIGKVAIVYDKENLIVGNNLIRISPIKDLIPPEYILGYLMSESGQEQINMYSGGSAISYINSTNLGKIKIPIFDQRKVMLITELVINYLNLKKEEKEIIKKLKQKQSRTLQDLSVTFGGIR